MLLLRLFHRLELLPVLLLRLLGEQVQSLLLPLLQELEQELEQEQDMSMQQGLVLRLLSLGILDVEEGSGKPVRRGGDVHIHGVQDLYVHSCILLHGWYDDLCCHNS